MRHRAGNMLRWQAYCEKIGALPRNAMECGKFDAYLRQMGSCDAYLCPGGEFICQMTFPPHQRRTTPMTPDEIHQAIEKLTLEIRVLSYSSTKAAAEKVLQLQEQRRELRTQLEALEP